MRTPKKLFVIMSVCLALLLSGCGTKQEEKRLAEFSAALSENSGLSFTASLRCEYPEKVEEFTMLFERTPSGCDVTLIEPEIISGIKAHIEDETNRLEYEGIILDVGTLDAYGLSPMSALPVLYKTLCAPYINCVWAEGDTTVYSLTYDDNTCVSVWFTQDMIPTRAETICDGTVTVFCDIENWS